MKQQKLLIELMNHEYEGDLVYGAIAFTGGFAIHKYEIDGEEFVSNQSFYNVIFNYFRNIAELNDVHFDVQRSVATISFCRNKVNLLAHLKNILKLLYEFKYNEQCFEMAKQNTIDSFSEKYKDGKFRGTYKAFEFADLNKRYTLAQLIQDIDSITFEEFKECANRLITPGNTCIYLCGNVSDIDLSSLKMDEYDDKYFKLISVVGPGFDSYIREDAHLLNVARKDCNIQVEAFDFFNEEISNFSKQLIVETLSELVVGTNKNVWIDSYDASIVYETVQLKSYKEQFNELDERKYSQINKSLLSKYISLLENMPEHFVIKAVSLMTVGIYIDQYISFLSECNYDLFKELNEKADYKITEAQVVLRRELA